jgi:hypothetical protein
VPSGRGDHTHNDTVYSTRKYATNKKLTQWIVEPTKHLPVFIYIILTTLPFPVQIQEAGGTTYEAEGDTAFLLFSCYDPT